jgi:hypothetical protein
MLWEGSGRRFDAVLKVIIHHQPYTDERVVDDDGENCQEKYRKKSRLFFRPTIALGAASIVVDVTHKRVVTSRRDRR